MKISVGILSLSLMVSPLTQINAGTDVMPKEELVQTVLDISQAETQFDQIPMMLNQALMGQKDKLEPADFENFSQAVMKAFDVEEMKSTFRENFSQKIKRHSLNKVLDWYASETGEVISFIEMDANTPEGQKKMMAYLQRIQGQNVGSKRSKLIFKLDKAANITDGVVDITLATTRGIMKGFNTLTPDDQKMSEKELNATLEKLRKQLTPTMKSSTLGAIIATYRDVSDQELAQYVKFLTSKAGKNFMESLSFGMNQACNQAAERTGIEIAKSFQ